MLVFCGDKSFMHDSATQYVIIYICDSENFGILLKVRKKSGKIKSNWQVYMISQVKSKNDVCSQEMYGYGSLL